MAQAGPDAQLGRRKRNRRPKLDPEKALIVNCPTDLANADTVCETGAGRWPPSA